MKHQTLHDYRQSARVLMAKNDWPTISNLAREVMRKFPNSVEGFFYGGLAAKRLGDIDDAKTHLGKALMLEPARYDVAVELAEVLVVLGKFSQSFDLLIRYESTMQNSSLYLVAASTLYSRLGMHEKAFEALVVADRLQPNVDTIKAKLAEVAVLLGKTDVATPIYQELILKYPHFQKHHYHYSKLQKATNSSHVTSMKEQIAYHKQPDDSNIFLFYALGKELEDLEQWDEAFSYYEKAGKAILSKANYSVQQDISTIDTVIERCNKAWFDEKPQSTNSELNGNIPIFIVGLPRTGTTLIERVLASHSRIETADETFLFQMALNANRSPNPYADIGADLIINSINIDTNHVAQQYLEMIDYKLKGKDFFIDKFPHNFLLLGFIAKAFPRAKLIYLNRHPMDSCFAMFKQSYFKFAYSLEDVGKYYEAHARLKAHWTDVLGERIIEVSYENFVRNQEQATRELLGKLGVEYDDNCLNFHKNPSASATASTLQVREEVHTRSVDRWKKFNKHLLPLEKYFTERGII